MRLLAIDPGTTHSGFVGMDGDGHVVEIEASCENKALTSYLENDGSTFYDELAIEMIASYGMPVGSEIFETCAWIGRFEQAFGIGKSSRIYRRDVKLHLCGSVRAKDSNVRQAIIDRYARTGGGKTPQVGTKKQPGPLYGMKSHAWPALGVGLTHLNMRKK